MGPRVRASPGVVHARTGAHPRPGAHAPRRDGEGLRGLRPLSADAAGGVRLQAAEHQVGFFHVCFSVTGEKPPQQKPPGEKLG